MSLPPNFFEIERTNPEGAARLLRLQRQSQRIDALLLVSGLAFVFLFAQLAMYPGQRSPMERWVDEAFTFTTTDPVALYCREIDRGSRGLERLGLLPEPPAIITEFNPGVVGKEPMWRVYCADWKSIQPRGVKFWILSAMNWPYQAMNAITD